VQPEAVLLGSAILGAVASADFPTIPDAMATLCRVGARITPSVSSVAKYHQAKHQIFQRMYADQLDYRELMDE
jgi:ribulose kinase